MPLLFLSHSRRQLSTYALVLTSFFRSISWKFPRMAPANPCIVGDQIGHGTSLRQLHHGPADSGARRGGKVLRCQKFAFPKGYQDTCLDRPCVNYALCTTLCRDGVRVRTVEHLLSVLEACGVDDCRIVIDGSEEMEHVDAAQLAERTIHERKLQEITNLREQLQQMEIELARAIARSEMLELQSIFEVTLKEQIDSNNNLKALNMR